MPKFEHNALINYIKSRRIELQEWLPLMKLQDGEFDVTSIITAGEEELAILMQIEECLIGLKSLNELIDTRALAIIKKVLADTLNESLNDEEVHHG